MRGFYIKIPQMQKLGLTYEETFRMMKIVQRHEISYLRGIYPSYDIQDIRGYSLMIAEKIMKMVDTLHSVIEYNKDYVVASMIVRSLADSISSFILIYSDMSNEINSLRHYLYILDGVKTRIKLLPDEFDNNRALLQDDYETLKKQVKCSKQNAQEAYDICCRHIKCLSMYKMNSSNIDSLIQKASWRFKYINRSKTIYSWREMYELIDLGNTDFFSEHLSGFVHGLSMSNLKIDDCEETFMPIYSCAISLLGKFGAIIRENYAVELSKMDLSTQILLDQDMPKHYVSRLIKRVCK